MSNTQGKPVMAAVAVAVALTTSWSWTTYAGEEAQAVNRVGAQRVLGPGDSWNTFRATVNVRRGRIDAAGQAIGDRVSVASYQVERVQSGRRWKTTMLVVSGARPDITTPAGTSLTVPPDIVSIEDDGEGGGLRLITRDGKVMGPPSGKDREKLSADSDLGAAADALFRGPSDAIARSRIASDEKEWIDAIMPARLRGDDRRLALQRRFGKAVGRLRGLDRYLESAPDHTTEVLADPDWTVPVEINVVRGGQLQSRARFSYDAGPGGSLVRRHSHVEQVLSKDVRAVVDVDLSSVRLEDRR